VNVLLLLVVALAACAPSTSDRAPTATPTVPASADAPLTVAWAQGGDLFVWRSSDAQTRRIASGGVIRPFISPDGDWVAYVRGPGGDPRALWLSDAPGANERQLVDATALPGQPDPRHVDQVVWAADSGAIFLNTLTGEGMDLRPADDLWRVDAPTGAVERLLADGAGGRIDSGPDGAWLALAAAGEYAQPGEPSRAPGVIAFYDLTARERHVALEFPAVATASQRRWYPEPRWMPDGSGVRVAIPAADLVYGEGTTALWHLPVSGEAVQIGQADADFFGLPEHSADGAWIAYLQRRTAPDQPTLTLMIARGDGSDPAPYAEGIIGDLGLPRWLETSAQFVYRNGDWFTGGPGGDPARFPAEDLSVSEIVWADARTYVFSAPAGEGFSLHFGMLDVPTRPQPIVTLPVYPVFDARLPEATPPQ
jgi:hypothetical protein